MNKRPFIDRFSTGALTGLVLPVFVFVLAYFILGKDKNFSSYVSRIVNKDVITHFMSLCVFPNVFAFLLFNRFNKLFSSRGVLGITIIWAFVVFIIKLT